jgi:hypothetical protein
LKVEVEEEGHGHDLAEVEVARLQKGAGQGAEEFAAGGALYALIGPKTPETSLIIYPGLASRASWTIRMEGAKDPLPALGLIQARCSELPSDPCSIKKLYLHKSPSGPDFPFRFFPKSWDDMGI